jgi:PAS domain S-box-containing protein
LSGKPAVAGSILDITAPKQAEEAIHESEYKYRALFDQAVDSILLIDIETGNILEFNDKAYEALGYTREEFQKLKIPDFEVSEIAAMRDRKIFKEGPQDFETKHRTKSGELRTIHVNARIISVRGKNVLQAIHRDITDIKQAEKQRDKLIAELQKALSEVKTLRGFLPICSYCKKIRDDKGYWSQIESYIHKHSDAEFSHGICPECAKKYFPDMDLYKDAK